MLTKKEAQYISFNLLNDRKYTIKYAGYCPADTEEGEFYTPHDIWRSYERDDYYLFVWVQRKAPEFKIIHKIDPYDGSFISDKKYFLNREVETDNFDELIIKSWTDGLVGSLLEWDKLQKQLYKGVQLTPISNRLNNYLKTALNNSKKIQNFDVLYSAQRVHPNNDVLTFPAWMCTSLKEYNLNPFIKDSSCIYKIHNVFGYELNSYENEVLLTPNTSFKVLSSTPKTITKYGGLWGDEEWDVNVTEYELEMICS